MTTSSAPTILLVEDDPHIRRFVRTALEGEGCRVAESDTMSQGLIEAGTRKPDLVILDLGLPDGDGCQFVQDLRTWSSMPVLVLSARAAEQDKIEALDAGADDYLTKPFELQELEARLRVLVRRMQAGMISNTIEVGPLQLDLGARRATLNGDPLGLTAKEFAALQALAIKAGQLIHKNQLIAKLTDLDQDMSSNALDILIHRLRKKLEGSAIELRTMRGFGYVLESRE